MALGLARITPSVQIRDNRYYVGQRTSLSHFGQGFAEHDDRLRPLIISNLALLIAYLIYICFRQRRLILISVQLTLYLFLELEM